MNRYAAWGLLGAIVLAGCASAPTLSAEQCSAMDWRALGEADGKNGQPMTALNDEIQLCAPHGIEPDLDTYKAGRAAGLVTYCAPVTLLDATIQAAGDPFVCEPFSDKQKTAFDRGREIRSAVARYQGLKQQYDQLVQRKAEINQEGARLTQAYNQTGDANQRQQIAAQITTLRQQLAAVDAEIAKADPVMKTEETTYQSTVKSYEALKASLAN